MINPILTVLTILLWPLGATALSAEKLSGIYPVPSTCSAPSATPGRAFYVDPKVGDMKNPGTADAPWSTLSAVIGSGLFTDGIIRAGDVIYLRSGEHGSISLSASNSDFITIAPDADATPVLTYLDIAGSNWIVKGLTIQNLGSTLVNVRRSASNNIIVGNHILSQGDVRAWSPKDWQKSSSTAVSIYDPCTTLLDNNIENVRWGILERADHVLIESNTIDNIGDDGMQVVASDVTIRGNRLTNFHDIGDGNHADMIQAINLSGRVFHDITIEANLGINQTDPNLPFPNPDTQGITEFDGRWDNYRVVNNVVITNHWHGIAIYGATNAKLVNNTVFGDIPGRVPWIGVFASKAGAPPVDNIVRNNLAGTYRYPATGYTQDHNVAVSDPLAAVLNFDLRNYAFDLHLRPGSPAIGAGTTTEAPATDIAGAARSAPIDAGAYAYKKPVGRDAPTAANPSHVDLSAAAMQGGQSPEVTATAQAAPADRSCTRPNYTACGYPDASNTGVPPGTALKSRSTDDGCLVVSKDDTVIEGLHVTGCIDVEANNVTIRSSHITGATGIWWAIKYGATKPNVTGLKILHVKVDSIPGQGPAAEGGYPYGISAQGAGSLEVGFSDISGFKDGIDVAHGYIHDNWIHDMCKYTDAHTQGIYVWSAPPEASLLIRHNTITDIVLDSTAAIFLKEGLGIHDVTIEDNWLAGGSYTLYGGGADARNIQARNNKFSTEIAEKGGQYGPISYWATPGSGNVWTDNVWANGPRARQPIAPAY
jgi:parallel beta-helix repeat protein